MKQIIVIVSVFFNIGIRHSFMPPYVPFPPVPIVADFYPENLFRMGLITLLMVAIPLFIHFFQMWLPIPKPPPIQELTTLTQIFQTYTMNNCYIYVNLIWQMRYMYGIMRFPWLIIHKLMGFNLIPASMINPIYEQLLKMEIKKYK